MTEQELFNFLLKIANIQTLAHGSCLGSTNRGYWQSYMYFIVLGGESVPTSQIGHCDTVALR